MGNSCTVALDRSTWRISTKSVVQEFEHRRITEAIAKRQRHKEAPPPDPNGTSPYICHICDRVCCANIGLISHLSTHRSSSSSFMMDSSSNNSNNGNNIGYSCVLPSLWKVLQFHRMTLYCKARHVVRQFCLCVLPLQSCTMSKRFNASYHKLNTSLLPRSSFSLAISRGHPQQGH